MWIEDRLNRLTTPQKTILKRILNGALSWGISILILASMPAAVVSYIAPRSWSIILVRVMISLFLLSVLIVFLLKWINPPISSYMLQVKWGLNARGPCREILHLWVEYSRINPDLTLGAIAFEDPNFLEHAGFAWGHILQVWQENRDGRRVKGASTITQQMTKNLLLWPARSYTRKVIEAYLALLMEVLLSKRRIMELYLNIVQFDRCVFGVESTSQKFFNKAAKDLTSSEAALLISVLPNPYYYRIQKPSVALKERQAYILAKINEMQQDKVYDLVQVGIMRNIKKVGRLLIERYRNGRKGVGWVSDVEYRDRLHREVNLLIEEGRYKKIGSVIATGRYLPGTDKAPWLPITPPVISTKEERNPVLYAAVIDQLGVEANPRYRRGQEGKNETYCNIFVWDVTRAMQAEIPHWVDASGGSVEVFKGRELDANGLIEWLEESGSAAGWKPVSAKRAQQYANLGVPAIAAWKNTQGTGHLAVVRPGIFSSQGGPTIAQVGGENFSQGTVAQGFSVVAQNRRVIYYVHE